MPATLLLNENEFKHDDFYDLYYNSLNKFYTVLQYPDPGLKHKIIDLQKIAGDIILLRSMLNLNTNLLKFDFSLLVLWSLKHPFAFIEKLVSSVCWRKHPSIVHHCYMCVASLPLTHNRWLLKLIYVLTLTHVNVNMNDKTVTHVMTPFLSKYALPNIMDPRTVLTIVLFNV